MIRFSGIEKKQGVPRGSRVYDHEAVLAFINCSRERPEDRDLFGARRAQLLCEQRSTFFIETASRACEDFPGVCSGFRLRIRPHSPRA